ncbi:hypothetical protein Patl1_10868 [Pistacia atlantica]|uniref:Uncharacterized protein n=1 Tax=Pistacia atlantica TaxID=434234 RepID=A0ACC1A838_9ROSI|nr:hypothetical protein Patl1_10868 [Pistacia atlantica]
MQFEEYAFLTELEFHSFHGVHNREHIFLYLHFINVFEFLPVARSFCSAAQEVRGEQFEDLLPFNSASSKKMKATKQEPDNVEALEGLDTLANLAIMGEGEALPASSQATTKHPRHRPGLFMHCVHSTPKWEGAQTQADMHM